MLVIAAIAVPLAWRSAADDIRSQVFVRMDDRVFECTNPDGVTFVPLEEDELEPEPRTPAVTATPEMDCLMTFFVVNESNSAVWVSSVVLPFMGGANGGGVHAGPAPMNGYTQKYVSSRDAVYDLTGPMGMDGPKELPAGETMRWQFPLTWSNGCMSAGGYMLMDDAPVVGVTALGLGGTIVHEGPSYAFVGTTASEQSSRCP